MTSCRHLGEVRGRGSSSGDEFQENSCDKQEQLPAKDRPEKLRRMNAQIWEEGDSSEIRAESGEPSPKRPRCGLHQAAPFLQKEA